MYISKPVCQHFDTLCRSRGRRCTGEGAATSMSNRLCADHGDVAPHATTPAAGLPRPHHELRLQAGRLPLREFRPPASRRPCLLQAGQPLIRRLALPDIAQGSLTSGRYCKSRSALHHRTLRAADVEVESSRMPVTGRAAADCCRGGRSRSDDRGATLTAAT